MMTKFQTAALVATLALPTGVLVAQQTGAQPGNIRVQEQRTQSLQTGQQRGQQDQQAQQVLAGELKLANEMEIQISQLAQDQAQNEQVKEFAQRMVQAHQQLNQQLAQAVPSVQQLSLQSGQAGQRQALGQQGQQDRLGQQGQQGQMGQQDDMAQQDTGGLGGDAGADVLAMPAGQQAQSPITQAHQSAAENLLQRKRQNLQQKQGAEFDKAYMAGQIAAHEMELARIEAYQQHMPQEAQQVLQQARQMTQQHLQQAEQIMRQLDQDSQG